MGQAFFDRPVLNSPYAYPSRHWELDEHGQPTQHIIEARRRAETLEFHAMQADVQEEMVGKS